MIHSANHTCRNTMTARRDCIHAIFAIHHHQMSRSTCIHVFDVVCKVWLTVDELLLCFSKVDEPIDVSCVVRQWCSGVLFEMAMVVLDPSSLAARYMGGAWAGIVKWILVEGLVVCYEAVVMACIGSGDYGG